MSKNVCGFGMGGFIISMMHPGGFLPTQSDISSTFATLMLSGPGLKRGYERPVEKFSYIHTADVVSTLCRIFNVAPAVQSQGFIVYDLFEGHEI